MNVASIMKDLTSTVSTDFYVDLLKEIEVYTKNRIAAKGEVIPFVPSGVQLQKIYDYISHVDLNLFSEDIVIESLKFDVQTHALMFAYSAKSDYLDLILTVDLDNPDLGEEFFKKLDKFESKILEDLTKQIHNAYDKSKFLIKRYPKRAAAIVSVTKLFSELFLSISSMLSDFIYNLIVNLIELLKTKKILEWINKAFDEIIKVIKNYFSVDKITV